MDAATLPRPFPTRTERPGGRPGAVLRSFVVRVGFLTHLLWDRYGPFWSSLAVAAGADPVHPDPEAVLDHLTDDRVAAVPDVVFRLAVAAALALDDTDLIVVPSLNPERDGGPGGAQDPWIADLPAALGRVRGAGPPLWPVAADLALAVETPAVSFLARLVHEPAKVRRAWAQHRAAARPPRRVPPPGAVRPSDGRVVAVVGQPWLATPAVARLATGPTERPLGPYGYDPEELRAEGRRVEARLIDTDAEALGAVRRFGRSAGVDVLRLVVDGGSASDAWLARRAEALAPRRLEVVDLRTLGDADARLRALLTPP
jgi:hypothetical protein